MPNQKETLDQYDLIVNDDLAAVKKKYSELIGRFLICFSSLEHDLNISIAEIIHDRTHETGYVVIEGMTFNNKIQLFYKLYSRLESATEKRFAHKLKYIKQSLSSINSFRNNIAHANWLSVSPAGFVRIKIIVDSEDGYVAFKKAKILPGMIREKIKEIEKLSDFLFEYQEEVMKF